MDHSTEEVPSGQNIKTFEQFIQELPEELQPAFQDLAGTIAFANQDPTHADPQAIGRQVEALYVQSGDKDRVGQFLKDFVATQDPESAFVTPIIDSLNAHSNETEPAKPSRPAILDEPRKLWEKFAKSRK